MTFLRSGRDLPSKQCVSMREKVGAGFRIGTSLLLSGISSCFSSIAWYSVPHRAFRTGTLSCSEGKGYTFDSCRLLEFFIDFTARYPEPDLISVLLYLIRARKQVWSQIFAPCT